MSAVGKFEKLDALFKVSLVGQTYALPLRIEVWPAPFSIDWNFLSK